VTAIRTRDEAETFRLDLLSRSDDAVIQTFKVCSEFPDEAAVALCLEEMARRNITCEFTLAPKELRAAARLARARDAHGQQPGAATASKGGGALSRLADYLDSAAQRIERRGSPAS
jgi:hypothetical protein